jgi:hypothetical protein
MSTFRQDDLDKKVTQDVKNHVFSFDGVEYEIDLGPANLSKLIRLLEPYMIRKTNSQSPTVTIRPAVTPTPAAIRSRMALAGRDQSSTG